MGVRDRLDQQALLGLGRHDRRARFAPLEHRLAAVQPQARRLLLRPVALDALLDQDRPDPRLEELDRLRRERLGRLRSPSARASTDPPSPISIATPRTTRQRVAPAIEPTTISRGPV